MAQGPHQLVPDFPAVSGEAGAGAVSAPRPRRRITAAVREQASELRSTWGAFWLSRVLVWAAGMAAFLLLGTKSAAVISFDPTRVSLAFGRLGNVLAAPAVRWDAVWFLRIAHDGYRLPAETRFFPLYPLLIRVGSWVTGSMVIAGLLISLVSLFVALELIRRLTELEFGAAPARATIWLIAFGPMALFLSAVYSESLFLALSAGTFYAARRGRWAWAGVLGGLAATTRIGGFLLFAPVLLMFFYGPRTDTAPALAGPWWKPRYRFTPAVLWSALIPAAAALVPAYMALRGLGAGATVSAQEKYSGHAITLPVIGAWDGAVAAWHQLTHQISAFPPGMYSGQEILQFSALVLGCIGLVAVFRRLPVAYGVSVALDFLLHLSTPTVGDPLRGFDRYASLRFPLFMVLGRWAVEKRRVRPLLAFSTVLLLFFASQFATWHWVGTPEI